MICLMLNSSDYPEKFEQHNFFKNNEKTMLDFESLIIDSINSYNENLNLEKIIYSKVSDFCELCSSTNTGLVLDEVYIENSNHLIELEEDGYNIYNIDNQDVAIKVLIYVFLMPVKETSRNIFCSQQMFPDWANIIQNCLENDNPNYSNRKIYIINLIDKTITANSMLKRLFSLSSIGIDIINVGEANQSFNLTPLGYLEQNDLSKHFDLDINRKVATLLIDDNLAGMEIVDGVKKIKGSNEKFYWMEILPVSIILFKLGFYIDMSNVNNYINNNLSLFNSSGDKIRRYKNIFEYISRLNRR